MPPKKTSPTGAGAAGTAVPAPESYNLMEHLEAENGALLLPPARVIIMSESAYTFLLKVIHEQSPHIVKYTFYDMGYRAGEQLMQTQTQRAKYPEMAFRYFVETYKQSGYGNVEVVSFDLSRPEAVLRGTNLFESDVAERAGIYRSPRTVDHYSRGMFAGFMSVLLGREMICEEMTCEFRGDPACEFLILPLEV